MALSEAQVQRYARHVLLPDVGGRGQERLLAATVAVPVGPARAAEVAALVYLAAAGVGTLVVTGDAGGLVTSAEQAAGLPYGRGEIGRPRIDVLRDRIVAINPDVTVALAGDRAVPLSAVPDAPGSNGPDLAAALIAGGAAAARTVAALLAPAAAP